MGNIGEAEEVISNVDPKALSPEYLLTYKFEAGRIKVAKGETEDALFILTQALRDADEMKPSAALASVRNWMEVLLKSAAARQIPRR